MEERAHDLSEILLFRQGLMISTKVKVRIVSLGPDSKVEPPE
jgi:hypothetical protein